MNFHNDIMNLPCDPDKALKSAAISAYKLGHRDARHAAAELALEADGRIDDLEAKLLDADYQARRKVACAMGLTEDGFNDGKRISFSWEYLLKIVTECCGSDK